jgi:hypothetical protein
MELLPAVARPLVLGSGVEFAPAEAAGHLQQHSLLDRPLDVAAAHVTLETGRQQEVDSAAGKGMPSSNDAAGGYGAAAAATEAEDVLVVEDTLCSLHSA